MLNGSESVAMRSFRFPFKLREKAIGVLGGLDFLLPGVMETFGL